MSRQNFIYNDGNDELKEFFDKKFVKKSEAKNNIIDDDLEDLNNDDLDDVDDEDLEDDDWYYNDDEDEDNDDDLFESDEDDNFD